MPSETIPQAHDERADQFVGSVDGHSEPPRISRDLLVLALGYRLQEIAHGGLGKATRRKLQTMAKAYLAMIRCQELDGFVEGLFGDEETIGLPERAHRGLGTLSEMRALMAAGHVTLTPQRRLRATSASLMP